MAGSFAGLVEMTKLIEHMCKLVVKYRSHMSTVISAGVTAGLITAGQQTTLEAWIDGLTGVCAILKLLTGY